METRKIKHKNMKPKKVKTKRGRKQDKALVSKQPHELKRVAKNTKKPLKEVRAAQKKTRSRKKLTAALTQTQSSATTKQFSHDSSKREKIG